MPTSYQAYEQPGVIGTVTRWTASNYLELHVAARSCRPEVAKASDRSTQKADADRRRCRAEDPQIERLYSLVIRLAAFAVADAGGPMLSARSCERTLDPMILREPTQRSQRAAASSSP
jgi:hypothetical protein